MPEFNYRFVDAYEKVSGVIEAADAGHAAILVLQDCGSEPQRPRWKRYGVKESIIAQTPNDAELVIYEGFEKNSYGLEITKVGTRKRKPLRLYA